jgi:hypothetical protein
MLGDNKDDGRISVNVALSVKTIQNLDYHRGQLTRTEFIRRLVRGNLAQLTAAIIADQERLDREKLADELKALKQSMDDGRTKPEA